ncbi:TBC1 domain family member 16 [Lampetra planeri]
MSLGRIFRHASELLSPQRATAAARGARGGEIVFSKNNVCVHPTEGVHAGQELHYPGYLCVEFDEGWGGGGGSLLLTWVPNARIEREDEEALRYVTPESSPVRRGSATLTSNKRRHTVGECSPTHGPVRPDRLSSSLSLPGGSLERPPAHGAHAPHGQDPPSVAEACGASRPGPHGDCLLTSVSSAGCNGSPVSKETSSTATSSQNSSDLVQPSAASSFSCPPSTDTNQSGMAIQLSTPGDSQSEPGLLPSPGNGQSDVTIQLSTPGNSLSEPIFLPSPGNGQSEPSFLPSPTNGQSEGNLFPITRGDSKDSNGNNNKATPLATIAEDGSQWVPPLLVCDEDRGRPSERGDDGRGEGGGVAGGEEEEEVSPRAPWETDPGWGARWGVEGGPGEMSWDERLKLSTLEQVDGVFSVDLGHMRSLRLFFSEEGGSSGHFVIASRESQYKVFHFHCGGLDRLADVFQRWKCCTLASPTHQVSDSRSYLHFCVNEPVGGVEGGAHPEEGCYRQLSRCSWLEHLTADGRVEEDYKIRKSIFFAGVATEVRGEVWPFLLKYYSFRSTSHEREQLRQHKRREYADVQLARLGMSQEDQERFWREVQYTVDRDVVRTDRSHPFYQGEDNPNVEIMRQILLNYAVYRPDVGYTQGMSDLLAPILAEVRDEADSFWCFVGLMQETIFFSSPRDEDMETQLTYLRELVRLMLPRFFEHLQSLGEDGLQMLFCHRWVLLCFKREFRESEALRMWEACWAHYQTDYFHLFVCLAIMDTYGGVVVQRGLSADAMLLHFTNLAGHMSGKLVLIKARGLLYRFRLLRRIPCSLHSLCVRCGSGMWDSGYVPAVECTGDHLDADGCPYGGLPPSLAAEPAP